MTFDLDICIKRSNQGPLVSLGVYHRQCIINSGAFRPRGLLSLCFMLFPTLKLPGGGGVFFLILSHFNFPRDAIFNDITAILDVPLDLLVKWEVIFAR